MKIEKCPMCKQLSNARNSNPFAQRNVQTKIWAIGSPENIIYQVKK